MAGGLEPADGLHERRRDYVRGRLVVSEAPERRVVRDDGESDRVAESVGGVERLLGGAVVEPEVLLDEQAGQQLGLGVSLGREAVGALRNGILCDLVSEPCEGEEAIGHRVNGGCDRRTLAVDSGPASFSTEQGPLNREGLRAQWRNEAKVAPTLGRAENAGALRRLAAAGYTALRRDAANEIKSPRVFDTLRDDEFARP